MPTMILGHNDITELLDAGEVIASLEQVLRDSVYGKTIMPPKAYLTLAGGDFRAMPAYIPGASGIKWVNVHPGNSARGIPTVMAVLIYNDPETGYPLAVMDATAITALRTGAAAAIASKYMARKNSRTLGIIGAGRQSYSQLQAHLEIFSFESIMIHDISTIAVEKFIKSFEKYPVRSSGLIEAAGADILCTLTPSTKPYLRKEWLVDGAHINAVGADAKGKEELYPEILTAAKVIVDDAYQAKEGGEINIPYSSGIFGEENIYASLGEIVAGEKPGRQNNDEITVFDSTGLAIEDIAVAKIIYEKALRKKSYLSFDMIEN